MQRKFLTAEWRKLIMANYLVEPEILKSFLPAKTAPDTWNGNTYVSLVGFMFCDTRIMGIQVPFHINFPEVNLRFYVRYPENNKYKRGVVFIKEIVPKPAISFIANSLFKERYISLPMRSSSITNGKLDVGYEWKTADRWNVLRVQATPVKQPFSENSEEEFITEHFWGYSAINGEKTGEYQVEHPRWEVYPVENYFIDCDFENLYGNAFTHLCKQTPCSVFLAEGSPVCVYNKRVL